jgi:YfiH family protein
MMILPTPSSGFVWREFNGSPALVCTALDSIAAHVFTTSAWSLGSPQAVVGDAAPWCDVAAAVGVDVTRLVRARQVHGTTVLVDPVSAAVPLSEADVVLVSEPHTAAGVQVADCVPLLLADAVTGAVAAVHAGWRGLVEGVPAVAVSAMHREFGTRASDVIAAVGPSVGACCYEVGPEVRDRFDANTIAALFIERPAAFEANPSMPRLREHPLRRDRWFFDGWEAVRRQLEASGVPGPAIHIARLCTASHPQVFCSYRRDGASAGRQAAAITAAPRRP